MQGTVETVPRDESSERVSSSRDWRCAVHDERRVMGAVPSVGRVLSHLRDCVAEFHGSDIPVSVTLRPLVARDAAAARRLADTLLGDAGYADAMRAALDEALSSETEEYRAIGAHDRGSLIGFIVFGATAGASGAGRISCVAVDTPARRRGVAKTLIEAACAELRAHHVRFAMIELPAEPELAPALSLASRAGFHEEARVSDYVRAGVSLLLLRRDLSP